MANLGSPILIDFWSTLPEEMCRGDPIPLYPP